MIEAVSGEPVYPELEDAPPDLVGTLTLRLLDAAGGVVQAASAAGITEPIDGLYRATRTAPTVAEDTYYRFWWAEGGTDIVSEVMLVLAEAPTYPEYPTLAALLAASSSTELAALDADQQAALREEAIAAVEAYCHQSFSVEGTNDDPVTKRIDGAGGKVLYLPKRLASLAEMELQGSGLVVDDLAISEDGARLEVVRESAGNYYTRALAKVSGGDLSSDFPYGSGAITITGVWGWAEVPVSVVTALRFHMEDRAAAEAHKLAPTVRAARALGLDSVNQGNLSLSMGTGEPMLSVRAQRQLQEPGLIWRAHGVAV